MNSLRVLAIVTFVSLLIGFTKISHADSDLNHCLVNDTYINGKLIQVSKGDAWKCRQQRKDYYIKLADERKQSFVKDPGKGVRLKKEIHTVIEKTGYLLQLSPKLRKGFKKTIVEKILTSLTKSLVDLSFEKEINEGIKKLGLDLDLKYNQIKKDGISKDEAIAISDSLQKLSTYLDEEISSDYLNASQSRKEKSSTEENRKVI